MGLSQIAAHFLIELTLCYKHMRAIIFGPSQEEFGPNLLKMGQKHKCTSAASQVTPSFKLCMSEATMGVGKQVCAMILNSKKISLPLVHWYMNGLLSRCQRLDNLDIKKGLSKYVIPDFMESLKA